MAPAECRRFHTSGFQIFPDPVGIQIPCFFYIQTLKRNGPCAADGSLFRGGPAHGNFCGTGHRNLAGFIPVSSIIFFCQAYVLYMIGDGKSIGFYLRQSLPELSGGWKRRFPGFCFPVSRRTGYSSRANASSSFSSTASIACSTIAPHFSVSTFVIESTFLFYGRMTVFFSCSEVC